MAAIGIAVFAFVIINIGIVEPVTATLESSKPFAEKMMSLQRERQGQIIFYQTGPDAEDIKFAASYGRAFKPTFIDNPQDLLNQSSHTYFISKRTAFDDLPAKIAQKMHLEYCGKIGHRDCVIFCQTLVLSKSDS